MFTAKIFNRETHVF